MSDNIAEVLQTPFGNDNQEAHNAEQGVDQPVERKLNLELTFTQEGVKIDVRSNLSALEQLGAVEIFKAHLLSSALGGDK